MGRMIWKNGLFLPEEEATVSIYDSMCLYGDAIFEMCRSFNKNLFKLDAHLDRLFDSAKFTEMPMPYSKAELKMAHHDLINRNRFEFRDDDEYRTYVNVSRGPLPIYSEILEPKPWVMVAVYPLRWTLRGFSRTYHSGVDAIIPAQKSIPSRYVENKIKHHARLHFRLAENEVKRQDERAWPLLLDDSGFVTESTGANFFLVKRDRLITPEPRNCLRGISRAYVMSLARKLNLDYRERNIEQYDVVTADEAFFTCTPACIVPCTSVNGQKIGNGKRGKMTSLLMDKWKEEVNCEWEEQAFLWDRKN